MKFKHLIIFVILIFDIYANPVTTNNLFSNSFSLLVFIYSFLVIIHYYSMYLKIKLKIIIIYYMMNKSILLQSLSIF